MKRALLLLTLPIVAGALYLRSLASWRPYKVFNAKGEVCHLVFSNDGKTLLVAQSNPSTGTLTKVVALDATRSFTTRWLYHDGSKLGKPQFYLSDSRVLVAGASIRTLNATTGQRLSKQSSMSQAAMSPDGKWLAHNNLSVIDGDAIVKSAEAPEDIFLDSLLPISSHLQAEQDLIIREEKRSDVSYFFSPDGQTFIANVIVPDEGDLRSRIDFYDVKTWKRTRFWWSDSRGEQRLFTGHIRLSRNGRFLISVCSFDNRNYTPPEAQIRLWRVRGAKRLSSQSIQCNTESYGFSSRIVVPSFEVQNDGRVLKFGTGGPVSLSKNTNLNDKFDTLLLLPNETITTATLSPDGSYVVAGTKSGRVIWKRVN